MSASAPVELEQARRMVLERAHRLPAEEVPLGLALLDRVLAEDVVAEGALPSFDNSAMDGFAVRSADLRAAGRERPVRLRLVGESRAGAPAGVALGAGEAIAISTGAMLPAGADAVVRVEDAAQEDGHVLTSLAAGPGHDVRRAGEDVAAGATVLASGTPVGPAELGLLAALGRTVVRCTRRAAVALLVSGDELLAPGERDRPGGVRDTSSLTLAALIDRAGARVAAGGRLSDDAVRTREGIADAIAAADVCVICGGVSVGVHDHVRPALAELGAEEVFWGLALKPGRPVWFGTHGASLVFGLPGNPVSSVVTFLLLVAPALRALAGAREADLRATAVLDGGYTKAAGRAHAVRCRLTAAEDGWHARPTGPQGSHVISSLLEADALAIIPAQATRVAAGERVAIEPLRPLAWRAA